MVDEKKKGGAPSKDKKPAASKAPAKKTAGKPAAKPAAKAGLPKIAPKGDPIARMLKTLESLSQADGAKALEDEKYRSALADVLQDALDTLGNLMADGKFPALLPMATFLPFHVRMLRHMKEHKGAQPDQETFEALMDAAMGELLVEDMDVLEEVFGAYLDENDPEGKTPEGARVEAAIALLDFGAAEPMVSAMMMAATEGQGLVFLDTENLPEFDKEGFLSRYEDLSADLFYRWALALKEGDLLGIALRTLRLTEVAGFEFSPEAKQLIEALKEEGAEEPGEEGGCCCGEEDCDDCGDAEPEK